MKSESEVNLRGSELVSDDPHKLADDSHEAVADDAVSNRSDDTMLEEEPRPENGAARGPSELVEADQAVAAESEAAVISGGADIDEAKAVESQDEPVAEEDVEAEVTEEEAAEEDDTEKYSGRGAIEEDLSEEEIQMNWYILKVQSNRERSIAEALERKMKIEGLDRFFDQVIVPTEKVTEFKAGKKKVVERKLYPGYIVVHMHINDDTWFAVRETSGVGDFTGAGGKPTPMLPQEVARDRADRGRGNQRGAEAGYQVLGRRQSEGQRRQLREFRRRSGFDRRSEWPGDGDDQHLRPQHAGGTGILAD